MNEFSAELSKLFNETKFVEANQLLVPWQINTTIDQTEPFSAIFLCPLECISIEGIDAASFLQGLVSNNIYKLTNLNRSLRTFSTSNTGKILFDIYVRYEKEHCYQLYCEPTQAIELLKHFEFYHIIEQFELQLKQEIYCAYCFNVNTPPGEILYADTHCQVCKISNFQNIADYSPNIIGLEQYDQIRQFFNWARSGVDFNQAHYPLETRINLVDYKKGCFIGQEPIARMYHKGIATKELRQFKHNQTLQLPADIINNDQKIGTLTSTSNLAIYSEYYSLGYIKKYIAEDKKSQLSVQGINITLLE